MAGVDRAAPVQFLSTFFEPEDWVAIFLKSYHRIGVAQRVGPVSWVQSERFQRWLRQRHRDRAGVAGLHRALAGHDDVIAEGQECVRLATPDNWPMGIGHVRRRSGSRALVARDGGRVRRHDPAKARRGVDASRHAAASRRSWASLETRDAASLPECDVVLLRRLPRVGMDSASLSSRPGVFAATRVARADQPAAARDQRSFGMRCSGDT
jgi:hypothetical protein